MNDLPKPESQPSQPEPTENTSSESQEVPTSDVSVLAQKVAELEQRTDANTAQIVGVLHAIDERVCVLLQVVKDMHARSLKTKTDGEIDWQAYHTDYVEKATQESKSTPTTKEEEEEYPEGTHVFGGA